MNLKLIFTIIFLAIIAFVVARFFTSGQPLTIEAVSTYIQTGTQTTFDSIQLFITEKWQIVTATIGAVTTVFLGIYRSIKSKFTAVQGTATSARNQLDKTQTMMTEQYNTMQSTIKTQETKIGDLEAKVISNADLQQKLTYAENYADNLDSQLQIKTAEVNTLQQVANTDYVRSLEESLRLHGIPLPRYDGEVITVVK